MTEKEMQSKLSQLMNDKLNLKKDEKLKKEFNNYVNIINQKEFSDASNVYQQKRNLLKDIEKSKALTQMLNTFNKMPKDDSDEYRTQLRKIKEYFQENKDITHTVNDHIKDIDTFHKTKVENGTEKTSENMANKSKENKKKSIQKNNEINTYDKLTFPFRKKEECQSRSISQPTFVKKSDMVRIMGKLGFQEKVGIPLSNMTKDELCNLYFDVK